MALSHFQCADERSDKEVGHSRDNVGVKPLRTPPHPDEEKSSEEDPQEVVEDQADGASGAVH